ncbi:uncharacterized protein ACHE_70852S [Aspergillus chevalieri]|uniref:Uncharacterized protein n=1 Tax=Aspergillus chevalieri TaxID=182096 RepID=A0A7R7VWC5_ASPCH|nr:uncharacterized protein ACHE_70852S [Aspergillus chevalieri]BCR92009.1 hypothetical protein ACHE_70852S [Aspergillus chevalieri]
MEFAHVNLLNSSIDSEGDGAAIIDYLEWNIQEDPAMERCSVDDMAGDYIPSLVRWRHPIFIDKESVDSVLAGPALGTWDSEDYHNPTAYVIVMHTRWWDCQEEEEVEERHFTINGC